MRAYLSIDIDFWNSFRKKDSLHCLLIKVREKQAAGTPLFICDSHEDMLADVDKFDLDTLINIDAHSDISNRFDPEHEGKPGWECTFNCGTWTNWVRWREDGDFVWVHPFGFERSGTCHFPYDRNPFRNPALSGWHDLEHLKHRRPHLYVDWGYVKAIGIAFSYHWTTKDSNIDLATEMLGVKPLKKKNPLL